MEKKVIYKKFKRERLDFYLASVYKNHSRSYFQKLIYNKKILVNNKITSSSSYKLKYGDVIIFEFEDGKVLLIEEPENIKLNIIYEDTDIIVVNKPAGIVVHPGCGHLSGTLINALVGYSKGDYKPYLVHRLDKDTSGAIIFAKNEKTKTDISEQFQNRDVKKMYYVAVKGTIIENRGKIEAPLGRSQQNRKLMTVNSLAKKIAITEFKTILRNDGYTLLEVRIITGRTHQIRSHMKYINHPVVGDQQYGGPKIINGKQFNRQMLHSYNISFVHPKTMKIMEFIAELPTDMKRMLI
ncbi:MAG: RluA family pseudouridine synthase [Endomicrobium sp.]|jgi:23S rRNA pseudouridine1911/1915/1917 synthase|nr:RluA family pseudouridine synthase [Endomicrobium sp.]